MFLGFGSFSWPGEHKLEKGNLLTTFATFGPEFSIDFELLILKNGSKTWQNVLQLSSMATSSNYGTPGVWLFGNEKLLITSEVNGNGNYPYNHDEPLEISRWIHFEIEQLLEDGKVI